MEGNVIISDVVHFDENRTPAEYFEKSQLEYYKMQFNMFPKYWTIQIQLLM